MAPVAKPKSAKPMIAGVMYVLALLIGLWMTTMFWSAYSLIQAGDPLMPTESLGMLGFLEGVVLIFLVLSIIGVVGCAMAMIFSFMRKNFGLAVVGGVLALVGLHLLFGLIGLILLLTSKDEFS